MDDVFSYKTNEEEDYYSILGCDPLSTQYTLEMNLQFIYRKFLPTCYRVTNPVIAYALKGQAHVLAGQVKITEQITAEYKARVLDCHPDKHPGDHSAAKKFECIQTAKDVLCDLERRQHYDKWRQAGLAIPFKKWCNMRDAVHTSMHWAMPKKDYMLEGNNCEQQTDSSGSTCHSSKTQTDVDSDFINNATQGGQQKSRSDVPWEREPASDILRKFRNYEI